MCLGGLWGEESLNEFPEAAILAKPVMSIKNQYAHKECGDSNSAYRDG